MTTERATLLLLLLSVGDTTVMSTSAFDPSECRLWIAPSTIPGAGLGVFNGATEIEAGVADALDVDQVVLPFINMEINNGGFEGNSQSAAASNWRDYLMNFVISPLTFKWHDHFTTDTMFFASGTGSLVNSKTSVLNIDEPYHLEVDSLDMHRTTDPGVGGFSTIHGYHTPTLTKIPPFSEIFSDYGETWFADKVEMLGGKVPRPEDYQTAQDVLSEFGKLQQLHGLPETTMQAFYQLLFERLDKSQQEYDKSFQSFVSNHMGLSTKILPDIAVLLQRMLDLNEDSILALPRDWADVKAAIEAGSSLRDVEQAKSIRSLEYLEKYGRCMDGLVVGESQIPQAGRGAFARRSVAQGEVVAHSPLFHIIDRNMLRMYATRLVEDDKESWEERDVDDPIGWQIALNYCFGRPDTTLLLCPYGSSAFYINHSLEPNVKVVWANNTSWMDPKCLAMTPKRMGFQQSTCLAVDYVALRDIQEGEEIVLDYGSDWQGAWHRHLNTWKPEDDFAFYVRASDMNKDLTSPLRTLEEEEDGEPYSPNLQFHCRHPKDKTMHPCDILRRDTVGRNADGTPIYSYTVHLEINWNEFPADETLELHSGLARKDILFVDQWDADDEYLPNAFRQPMHMPDEIFSERWRNKNPSRVQPGEDDDCADRDGECPWGDDDGEDDDQAHDFVSSPHLRPGEIQPIRWADTKARVNQYSARVGLDPKLTQELLSYAKRLGIIDLFWDLLQLKEPLKPGSHKFFNVDPNDDQLMYFVNRPEKKWLSNMHWANAGNEHTHEDYLKVLAAGNFDQTLDAIGRFFNLDGLFVQGVCFMGVSHCDQGYVHYDMTDTGGKFFNVIIPLVAVENSPPEFILQDDATSREGRAKYVFDEAMVVGDDAMHGTSACDYVSDKSGIRISASIYIADVNEDNVDIITSDTTTIFPIPLHTDWAMASRARHWGGDNRLVGDRGRKPISSNVDEWDNCAELAAKGACETDAWDMRASCVKTCRVFDGPDASDISTVQTFESDKNNEDVVGSPKSDFVGSPHLRPGEIQPIRWADTKARVNQYSARVGLDPKLTQELLSYAKRLGIIDLFWDLLQLKEPLKPGSHKFFNVDPNDDQLMYFVNRPEKKWLSNMHWANAGNEHTHEDYLKVLAAGNFDQTLDAIGRFFNLDGLFVQGVCFMGVSHCDQGYVHYDMTDTGGKFFNVIIPLVAVENSPPEFILQDDATSREGRAKYVFDEAMVVGDDAMHGTSACDYVSDKSGIRISASIYIADVNEDNVDIITSDTTTIFPIPLHTDWAMASRARHWGGDNRLVGDRGRKPISSNVDEWDNCAELAAKGACETDAWDMRASCVKTCRVFDGPDASDISTVQTFESDKNNEDVVGSPKSDFVGSPHLRPGEIQPIRWADTKARVNQYSARVGLDPKLTQELLSYAKRLGIIDLFWDLLQLKEPLKPGSHKFFNVDPNDDQLMYFVNRPEKKWLSNMHWANAGNEHTHEDYLKVLAAGNFDQTLDAIGRFFNLDGLFVQGVCFMGVSHCDQGYVHYDMTDTGGKFFNVIIPLVAVENSPPEFILQDDATSREGRAKYVFDEAMVVGDDAMHGTSACDYVSDKSGIRISASIYIADVNEDNVDIITSDTTTIFPIPLHTDWAMASRARHWGGDNRLVGDRGRKPISSNVDEWDNCAELATKGACETDAWDMRPSCVRTCGVFLPDDSNEDENNVSYS